MKKTDHFHAPLNQGIQGDSKGVISHRFKGGLKPLEMKAKASVDRIKANEDGLTEGAKSGASEECQPKVDTKAFTGRRESAHTRALKKRLTLDADGSEEALESVPMPLIRSMSESVGESKRIKDKLKEIEAEMEELIRITANLPGHTMKLFMHKKDTTGIRRVIWRELPRRKINERMVIDIIKNYRESKNKELYLAIFNKGIELNEMHKELRSRHRTMARLSGFKEMMDE
jgi:hypothetical protein